MYKDSPLKGLLAQMARSSKGEKKVSTASRSLSWLNILKTVHFDCLLSCSLPGQVGELSERLPEGGSVGDRHLRPQEDHEGNPDRL